MRHHALLGALMSAALAASIGSAVAWDDAKYPDLQGHWARFTVRGVPGQPSFDQTKPWGAGQQAPLTPEYRAIFEASLADQAKGGEGNYAGHASALGIQIRNGRNTSVPKAICRSSSATSIISSAGTDC